MEGWRGAVAVPPWIRDIFMSFPILYFFHFRMSTRLSFFSCQFRMHYLHSTEFSIFPIFICMLVYRIGHYSKPKKHMIFSKKNERGRFFQNILDFLSLNSGRRRSRAHRLQWGFLKIVGVVGSDSLMLLRKTGARIRRRSMAML